MNEAQILGSLYKKGFSVESISKSTGYSCRAIRQTIRADKIQPYPVAVTLRLYISEKLGLPLNRIWDVPIRSTNYTGPRSDTYRPKNYEPDSYGAKLRSIHKLHDKYFPNGIPKNLYGHIITNDMILRLVKENKSKQPPAEKEPEDTAPRGPIRSWLKRLAYKLYQSL